VGEKRFVLGEGHVEFQYGGWSERPTGITLVSPGHELIHLLKEPKIKKKAYRLVLEEVKESSPREGGAK